MLDNSRLELYIKGMMQQKAPMTGMIWIFPKILMQHIYPFKGPCRKRKEPIDGEIIPPCRRYASVAMVTGLGRGGALHP